MSNLKFNGFSGLKILNRDAAVLFFAHNSIEILNATKVNYLNNYLLKNAYLLESGLTLYTRKSEIRCNGMSVYESK